MEDSISQIQYFTGGTAVVVLTDGSTLPLTEDDIDMLQLAFPGECEACGFDPNNEPSYEED